MPSSAYLAQPIIQRLPSLLREIREGEIRIPRFQRPFVWTTEQRLDLFRSIYEGIPIGSILIWRTKDHALRCYDHLGRLPLAWCGEKEEEEKRVRQYVLDGHQRLTTLFDALGAGLITADQATKAVAANQDEELLDGIPPVYFDLEERTFRIHRRPGKLPDQWLPLSDLLDPYKLFEFQKRHLEAGADRTLVNRAESLASTFKDYTIPVVPIVTEDLELATQSFQRVNSDGTPMNEVHMVSALTWSPDFDLNELIREVQTELGEVGWQDLEDKMILNTCKAALDLDIYYADTEEIRKAIKERPQVLEEASKSLKAAARFLRAECKIYGPAILPYSFQIVLLADAIWRATDCLQRELSQETAALIRKWFWLTTYTEHFAGISAVRLARTLDHLRKLTAEGGVPEPPGASFRVAPIPRRFDFRSARSRAIALRMADLQAYGRKLAGQDPYELLSVYGRHAITKIFPYSGNYFEGPENRVLDHPQAFGLREELRILGLGLMVKMEEDAKFLALHAVSEAAAEALSMEDLEAFLVHRRKTLIDLEEQFVMDLDLQYDRG